MVVWQLQEMNTYLSPELVMRRNVKNYLFIPILESTADDDLNSRWVQVMSM